MDRTTKAHFAKIKSVHIANMKNTRKKYKEFIDNETKHIIKLIGIEKDIANSNVDEILKKVQADPMNNLSYESQFENAYDTFKKNMRSVCGTQTIDEIPLFRSGTAIDDNLPLFGSGTAIDEIPLFRSGTAVDEIAAPHTPVDDKFEFDMTGWTTPPVYALDINEKRELFDEIEKLSDEKLVKVQQIILASLPPHMQTYDKFKIDFGTLDDATLRRLHDYYVIGKSESPSEKNTPIRKQSPSRRKTPTPKKSPTRRKTPTPKKSPTRRKTPTPLQIQMAMEKDRKKREEQVNNFKKDKGSSEDYF
jgi:hypothetical protein